MEELKRTTKHEWNRFLRSPAGIEGLLYLRERTPQIDAKEQATIVLQAGVSQGYRSALDALDAILADVPAKEVGYENE